MCTLHKHGQLYCLTLTGDGDEHRLNPILLDSITSLLSQIRSDSPIGAALITTAEGKFFSNGLDLSFARTSPSTHTPLLSSSLQRTIAAFLSLPIPTIAAVTGHAAGAGAGLVLCHDYVLMRQDRGFLYMSELDLGLPIVRWFMALMRAKIADPRSLRDVLLGGVKISAAHGVRMGIVDRAVCGKEETVEAARRLGEELAGRKWDGEAYAAARRAAFVEVFEELYGSSDAVEELSRSSDAVVRATVEGNRDVVARL